MRRFIAWVDRHPGVSLVLAIIMCIAAQTAYISWRYDGSATAARLRWDVREGETRRNHVESITAINALRAADAARCTSH